MGSHNGTYVPWHETFWTHPKTRAACAVLVEERIAPEVAPALVGRWLHGLSCWCLRTGDEGTTGGLPDAELAQIAWPEAVAQGRKRPAAIGALIRRALRTPAPGMGAYLEGEGAAEAIHDFEDHNRGILYDRRRRRESRRQGQPPPDAPRTQQAPDAVGVPGRVPGQVLGHVPGQSDDGSAARPSLARASGKRQAASGFAGGGDRAADGPPEGPAARGGGRPLSIEEQDRRRLANEQAASARCSDCRSAPRAPGRAVCASCAAPRRAPAPTPPAAT